MINITFPDNTIKGFENIPTGMDVAKGISDGFARNCVAMKINEQLLDLNQTIKKDTAISFITAKDDEGLDILRHSSAHVMAEAVLNIYTDAKLTIGPVVEDGFYYDIDMDPVSKDDLGAIEAEMKKIIKAKNTFERKVVSKKQALA
ncbi:MAG: TGS domain-containing protein, partial [Desulfobacula sp.]|nr:TGS domain-containing protein [Desulfobacula sp.]